MHVVYAECNVCYGRVSVCPSDCLSQQLHIKTVAHHQEMNNGLWLSDCSVHFSQTKNQIFLQINLIGAQNRTKVSKQDICVMSITKLLRYGEHIVVTMSQKGNKNFY